MNETPFSPKIQPLKKAVEVGDTNQIYYDPDHPESVIRIPTDKEAKFLKNDPKLINIAEKIYKRLGDLGKALDIDIALHQFILAKETSDGPVKPMLLAKKIEGHHLVPIDRNNPETLEALDRIVKLGFKYLDWIDSNKPRSIVTDIFRPDQYLAHPGKTHEKLTLIDIEARLKDRESGIRFIENELSNVVGPLRDTNYNDTFCKFVHYVLKKLKRNPGDRSMSGLLQIIINFPEVYRQMSDDFLAGREINVSQKIKERIHNTPLIINKEVLRKFGIEKI